MVFLAQIVDCLKELWLSILYLTAPSGENGVTNQNKQGKKEYIYRYSEV